MAPLAAMSTSAYMYIPVGEYPEVTRVEPSAPSEVTTGEDQLDSSKLVLGSMLIYKDQMAKLVHLACLAIRSVPYFEYIESAANGADEISRKMLSQ